MVALTAGRAVAEKDGSRFNFPVAANAIIFKGAMVALDTAGNLVPVTAVSTLRVVGVSRQDINATGLAAGDLRCEVKAGVFVFVNSAAADQITEANAFGHVVYAQDDQTVALTDNGNRPPAGVCAGVDQFGVWVEVGPIDSAGVAGPAQDAGVITVAGQINSNISASAEVFRYVHSGPAKRVQSIRSVISAVLATGDMTLTAAINGTPITGGVVTVAFAGTVAGDIDVTVPTANNIISEGQVLTITVGGTNTGAGRTNLTIELAPV